MAAVKPKRLPVDEGYAWVICGGCAVSFFVTMGVSKSLGVMLIEFQDHFKSDPSLTSLTVALVAAGFFLFVFFANTLGLFIGNRNVAIGGASLAFLSVLITAFAPNIYFVVFFLGLLSGIAYSGLFGPPLIILSSYFTKRRALATGLAVGGGSIGQLSIPLLFNFLVQHYGFQGGMLVFSGVVLQAVPACMLLRPPQWWDRKPKATELKEIKTISGGEKKKEPGCCGRFGAILKIMLDKELFTSPIFGMLVGSILLAHLGYFAAVIFLPTCFNSFFDNRTLSVVLVSVMGICDLAGRLLGGYIADLKKIKINDLMGISLIVPGVITVFAGIFPSIPLMFIAAVFLGSFAGSYAALLTPVIIEYFGLAKVSPGFGILTFAMGLLLAPWPTVLALITKAIGSYKGVLAISGAFLSVGGMMFFFMRFIVEREERKKKAKEAATAVAEGATVDAQEEPQSKDRSHSGSSSKKGIDEVDDVVIEPVKVIHVSELREEGTAEEKVPLSSVDGANNSDIHVAQA